jgi:hypothetical protein
LIHEKAKPNRCVAARAPNNVPCPVLPIALRVGELRDAHAGAEEREGKNSNSATADQIDRFRAAVEETASFERACSPAGALFQVGLAQQAAIDLFNMIPDGDKFTDPTYQKLLRLLDPVALVLRDGCAAQDYQAGKMWSGFTSALTGLILTHRSNGGRTSRSWLKSIGDRKRRRPSRPDLRASRSRRGNSAAFLCEGDANPFVRSPDDIAVLTNIERCKVKGNFVGNACGVWYVKRSSGRRDIADSAFDVLAIELNRSGLEHTLAIYCASLGHNLPI